MFVGALCVSGPETALSKRIHQLADIRRKRTRRFEVGARPHGHNVRQLALTLGIEIGAYSRLQTFHRLVEVQSTRH